MELQGVNRQTLREQVLDLLRAAITSGRLPLGSSLIETDLASTYGVSRGTVREALRELQAAGLVAGDSRGKLHVRTPGRREIAELFRVRGALEGLAVREIVRSDRLADAAVDLRAHLPADSGDFTERMNADLAFHERLVQLSENATLLTLWKGLEDRMRIIFFAGDGPEGSPLMTYAQHEPIVDAIASGDLRAAHDTLLAHMEEAAHRWAAQPLSAAPID